MQRNLQVVPWHGLVHAEHLDLVLRAHLGLVQVDVVKARATAIGCRARVIGGRRIRRDGVGDRLHAVRHARQLAEQFDELGVDALARCKILTIQLLRIVKVELWIGTQVLEERLKVAIELDFFDDFHHLVANAFDLVQADAVNLVRRHAGRRVGARAKLIPGGAVWHRG